MKQAIAMAMVAAIAVVAGCGRGSSGDIYAPTQPAAKSPLSYIEINQISLTPATWPAATSLVARVPTRPINVFYRQGILSVKADGVPLRDVLAEITRAAEVMFVLGEDDGGAVSVNLGPGPARQVIGNLIDRSGYGYALIEGNDGQDAPPTRVILTRNGPDRWAGQATPAGATHSKVPQIGATPALMDEATRQQHRAFEELMDACKSDVACDTS